MGRPGTRWATLLSWFCLACAGEIAPRPSGATPEAPPDRPTREPPGQPATVGAGRAADPGPLVRLTPTQLANVARDLFGVNGAAPSEFPAIDASDTKVDLAPLLSAQLAAAELVATRAFASGTMACAERGCATSFITSQGRLLFRRPLTDQEKAALLGVYDASLGLGPREALRQTLVAMLVSVPFLYRVERPLDGRPRLTSDEIATRMAFLAWNSGPSAELLDLGAGGGLDTGAARARQLELMLKNEKGVRGARDLVAGWLGTRKVTEIRKDTSLAAVFTPQVAAAMAEETERFAADAFAAEGASFVELFTAGHSFVNAALVPIYGVGGARGAEFERVTMPTGQRSGVLTHASVLAVHTNPVEASPVERGVFIYEGLLCQKRPEVPQDVPALPAAEADGKRLSQRERLERHRAEPSCRACHEVFDGFGLALENYDLVGRWVGREGDTPLTGEATITGLDGRTHRFRGATELGRLLAASPTARACLVEKVYRLTSGQLREEVDPGALDRVTAAFTSSGNLRNVLVDIAADPSFVTRRF